MRHIINKNGKILSLAIMLVALTLLIAACKPITKQASDTGDTNQIPIDTPAADVMDKSETSETDTFTQDENTGEEDVMMDSTTKNDDTDSSQAMQKQTISISGTNFKFDVKEIKVKKGDTVTINFKSAGGFHDWTVDEFNAKTNRVNNGESTSVTFTADQTGTFEYYCSVGNHRALGMVGILIVE